jgi:palmitoyltransferase
MLTLHQWAAINNQYAMCKFLLDHGAPINAVGGTSRATPLQWAAQRSQYYTCNLLLRHGADPLLTDGQGYNAFHIATFEGNVLLIVLFLHQGIAVDVLDEYGHTGLMWSAYKGYPQLVDVFLRWGADVHATDKQGFTALHWALVKGNPGCVLKLVEYGADRFALTSEGKTPAATAEMHNSLRVWRHVLAECGYGPDGHPVEPTLPGVSWLLKDPRAGMTRFLFFAPFLMVWLALVSLAYLPVYLGLPLAVASGWGVMQLAQRVMEYAPSDLRRFHKTVGSSLDLVMEATPLTLSSFSCQPWMSGIFAGCVTLVGLDWLFVVLPATYRSTTQPVLLLNLVFGGLYSMVVFYYVTTMRADPGFVPRLNGIAEQKAVIDELLSLWKFDENNFCVTCMIRMPLRSKHCKRCQRCVARHDQ